MKMKTWRCCKVLKVDSSSVSKIVELMVLKMRPAIEGSLLLMLCTRSGEEALLDAISTIGPAFLPPEI